MSVLLAAMAALSWGTSDFVGGLAAKEYSPMAVVVWSQITGLLVALVAAPWFGGSALGADLAWGAAVGAMGGIGLLGLYTGLANGKISVVAPVSGVVGAGIPVVIGILSGERPGGITITGMLVAVIAIWLVSAGEQLDTAGIGQAIIAGIGFGGFFVAIGQAADSAGLWPLVPARMASVGLIASLSLARGSTPRLPRTWKVGVAGIGDMAANVFFLLAAQVGLLSVAAVVSSLFPGPTVLLGRFVLKEKVRPVQWSGLALALMAVGLIARS